MFKHNPHLTLWAFVLLSVLPTRSAWAQTLPTGFSDAVVVGGFQEPVGITFDANGRLYTWEKNGKVWIVENGVRLAQPLIDLGEEVGDWRDHGMLGFALDPAFTANGHIYLMYLVDRHHLLKSGTGQYSAATNEYYQATIMRITRYTAIGPTFNTVNPASRLVLLGETKKTGVPVTHESHSTGSLLFGSDGTLLATVGDGATYNNVDVGSDPGTYFQQALTDSILRPAENVGALRCQMISSLNGKILRLDPATGNGVSSNPFYQPGSPRSAQSRVWALGLRNPYRATLRPGTGSANPADGDPGTIYFGDVGWGVWEDLNVCDEPGLNFGWPLFEGMEAQAGYAAALTQNSEAPNPLYGLGGCPDPYFNFQDLLRQATTSHINGHPNPCAPNAQVPNDVPHFFHQRPAIDWWHFGRSRSGGFDGDVAVTYDLNAVGAPVPGPSFIGNASVGGAWITGLGWPVGYQNVYMHADYGGAWIKRFVFNGEDEPVSVHDFGSDMGAVVCVREGPDGSIWYVRIETGEVRKISPIGITNLPPVARATQSVLYGPGPLSVSFSAATSTDPENGVLTYAWNFGDNTTGTGVSPTHVFTALIGVPTAYTVTLTVTDPEGATNVTTLLVSVNNTPPQVTITGFPDGHQYPAGRDTTYAMQSVVSDTEHSQAQLTWQYQVFLHHNNHFHPESPVLAQTGSFIVSGEGCYTDQYSYELRLRVTDAAGLSTTVSSWLYPRCSAIAPTAVIQSTIYSAPGPFLATITGLGSVDNGSIVSYAWDFGDGTSATGPTVNKTFTDIGEYHVRLVVTDNDGLLGMSERLVAVEGPWEPPQCAGSSGSCLREFYSAIPGATIADLLTAPNYPESPAVVGYPTTFQGPTDLANNYGNRFRAYIVPPTNGDYRFTTVSDDASIVYLSTDEDPANKQPICSNPTWCNVGEFDRFPEQTSALINLTAGRYYYVELLHKEGEGGDHVALYWQTPSNSTRVKVPGSAMVRYQVCPPSVKVRTFLQGPFNTSTRLMSDQLRTSGLIPSTEPFTALGFTHAGGGGGETLPSSMLTTTGMNAIVDWVLVELRSAATPATIIATRSALLQRDGDIVGTDGHTRLLFNVPNGSYHVAVRHRNHFGVMTASALQLSATAMPVDFTRSTSNTYGVDARATLTTGLTGQWCGNVVRDDQVKYTGANNDRDPILIAVGSSEPTNVVSGYLRTDVNLSGQVKYTGPENDRDRVLLTIGGSTPNAVRIEQLP